MQKKHRQSDVLLLAAGLAIIAVLFSVGIFYVFNIQKSHWSQLILAAVLAALAVFAFQRHYRSVKTKAAEVQHRENLFDMLTHNTKDIFILFSPDDFKAEYVSSNIERVLGIPVETVRADIRVILDAAVNKYKRHTSEELKALPPDGTWEAELHMRHMKTGEEFWYKISLYRSPNVDRDSFTLVLSDRTKERSLNDTLEEALNLAKAANDAKSHFLSNMSHDIRTPMNAIVGLCALLQRDAANEESVREHTKKITLASQHMLGLINDVLDMSKIESGKTTLNISEINIVEMVEGIGIILRPQAKAKQQTLEISVTDIRNEHLLGDGLRINQILINILSNAIKYTPMGGHIEMRIRQTRQTIANYASLRIVVRDNGIGMSEEYLKVIFKPFTREISSTTNKIQGTGLGMAITKNLVELMGGTIEVDSEPGKGSTFTVNLNLRIPEQEVDPHFWTDHGITRTLVVDDDEDACMGIMDAMTETGVTLDYAFNGTSAVEKVLAANEDGRDFDLILLDWKMPDLDGIEVTRRIREIIPDDVTIMALTAYEWSDIETEAIAAGVDGFLPKPFFRTNFKQTLEAMHAAGYAEQEQNADASVLAGKNVLAAEDIELNAEILTAFLDMAGAKCEVAENGQIVFEKFEASSPDQYDLILMDVQMPIMNGYEATRAIRAGSHPRAKTIPIIAMTANAFTDDIKDALDAGMDEHVAKPIDMEKLETALKNVLKRQRQ